MRAHAATYNIDTLRIATYGCSAGAQLAGLLGTTQGLGMYEYHAAHRHHSDAVQAVLNIDGVVSFVHPEAAPEHSGKSANAWLGPYPDSLARWTEASPLTHAGADTPPCLFLNSSHPRFHAGRDDMVAILQRHGTYYDIHTFEGSPHSFWLLHPWFEPTHERVVRFLKRVF